MNRRDISMHLYKIFQYCARNYMNYKKKEKRKIVFRSNDTK